MSQNPRLAWAIENNVHWYDALCQAHAIPGEHHLAFWLNRHVMPPYMSNLITLRDVADSEVQLAAIRSLRDAGVFGAVKDSFQCLSLTELGLRVLFHATWIFRDESSAAPADDSHLLWRVVQSPAELQRWEQTWRGVADDAEARALPQVFRPGLLSNPDFRFLLGERHGAVVATAALNRSRHAVGVSNVFSASEQPAQLFPGCVRLAHSTFPGLPLVGYERDQDLSAATAAGFEEVHGLTVWVPVES